MEEPRKQNMEIKNIISITVLDVDTNTKSRLVRLSFNRLSKIKRLSVVYFTIYQKENDKT